ncbi:LCP family protein [Streptomyces sp. NPDC091376]|uniref:LCP family protein n=1 Tax=Streptomyces sp. NPDC091376 TaxID=3365994 RepID=UPI003805325D
MSRGRTGVARRPSGDRAEGSGIPVSRREAGSLRRARRRSRVTRKCLVVVLVLAVLGGAGVAYGLYARLSGNLTAADIDSSLGDDRPAAQSGAMNIALIGSDSREGTNGAYGQGLTSAQSDTLMVLHLSADRKRATVVSVPRDSWVSIPACDLGDGRMSKPETFKINKAFATGSAGGGVAGGAACTIKTLEHNTGLRIDHFAEVNFGGFKDMVNTLGGVRMCLPEAVKDVKAGISLPAGCQVLKGDDALGYARARYSVGDGSDLGRISRQQTMLAALAASVSDKKFDAVSMYKIADAATKSLTVDAKLGKLSEILSLAKTLQSLPKDNLTFLTVPNYPRELDVPSDKANVVWKPEAKDLFTALAQDIPVDEHGKPVHTPAGTKPTAPTPTPTPTPTKSEPAVKADVKVSVLNAAAVTGKAASVASRLRNGDFTVVRVGNASAPLTRTIIEHGPAGKEQARKVADFFGLDHSRLRSKSQAASDVTLLIGSDYKSIGF